jgi:hypothetical protein
LIASVLVDLVPSVRCRVRNKGRTLVRCGFLLAVDIGDCLISDLVTQVATVIFTEVHFYNEGMSTLWDTDMVLDKCYWIVVLLLGFSALLPKKIAVKG